MTTKKKPAFEAFTVRESKGKSYFTKVGTAWPTQKGDGLMLYLDALPANGKLILTAPKPKQEAAPEAAPAAEDDDGAYIDDENSTYSV